MSDIQITSTRQSYLASALDKKPHTALGYTLRQNYPLLSKNVVIVQPKIAGTGECAGKEVVFDIPKVGMIIDAVCESSITFATATATSGLDIGLHAFSNQQVLFRGRAVCEFSDAYSVCRVDAEPDPAKQFGMIAASRLQFTNSVADTAVATSGTFYTPVWGTFLSSGTLQTSLDSSFVELFQLRMEYNQYARSGVFASSGAGLVSAYSNRLFLQYVNLDTEEWNKLRAINYDPSRPMQMLIESSITEINTLAAVTTAQTFDAKVNCFARQTDLYVRNNAIAGLAAIPIDSATAGYIDTYNVKVASRYIYPDLPYRYLLYNKQRVMGSLGLTFGPVDPTGASGYLALSTRPIRPVSFYWCMNNDRASNTGGLLISSKNNVQFIVTCSGTSPSTTNDLYTVHHVQYIMSIAPDGSCDLALAA